MVKPVDSGTDLVLYQGANLGQLSKLFDMDIRDVKAKITGNVEPIGERNGVPLFNVRDAAQYLVPPIYDLDEFIQKMQLADLPMLLRKEFWAAQRSRQLYEIEAAELWSTVEVENMVNDLYNAIRQSLLLSREAVERETELTKSQRKIITEIIDNTLKRTHDKIVEKFTESARQQATATEGSEDL